MQLLEQVVYLHGLLATGQKTGCGLWLSLLLRDHLGDHYRDHLHHFALTSLFSP